MELSRQNLAQPSMRLPGILRRNPAGLVAAGDALGIVLTGIACRSLNPAAHAGQTTRAAVVILATASLTVFLLAVQGFYRPGRDRDRLGILFTLWQSFALMLLALLLWEGFSALLPMPGAPDALLAVNRNWLFGWSVAAPPLILLTRAIFAERWHGAAQPPPLRRAILVADRAGLHRLRPVIVAGRLVQLTGILEITARGQRRISEDRPISGPALPSLREMRAQLAQGQADLLLIALPQSAGRRIAAIDRLTAGIAADIWLAPENAAPFYAAGARLSTLAAVPFVPLRDRPVAGLGTLVKRAEDLCIGTICLILLAPLMLIVGLAIRLTSPGPALFIQPRLGLNRRVIQVRKFRTMRMESGDSAGLRQAVAGDRRVTPLGRFLRRTSLDELPQLLNVLEGTMSLVGPRPHALLTEAGGLPFGEVAADYAARHSMKPGMTGWAQVCGWRGETDTKEKLRRRVAHDLHYIAHWSLWFDLKILALTVRTIAKGEGV